MDNLRHLRKTYKKTQQQMATLLGISQQAYAAYENAVANPPLDIIQKIADYFKVSVDYILGRTGIPVELQSLKFNDNIQPINLREETSFTKVPILGSIQAGTPRESISNDNIDDYIYVDSKEFGSDLVFGLVISGDSMEPRICPGDIAIIKFTDWVNSGDIAAVRVNGNETTLKTVKFEQSGMWLIGINPSFNPIYYSAKECSSLPITIIGKLIQVIQNY